VLIIDESGMWPYDRMAATALFTLVSARYERGSIIVTSKKGLGERGEVLGDDVIATAILDRFLARRQLHLPMDDNYTSPFLRGAIW